MTGKVGEGAAEEATLSSRLFSRLQSLTLTRERIQSRSSSRPGAPAGTSPSPPRGLKLLGTGPGPVSLPRPRHPARRGSAQALRGGRGGSVHTRGLPRDEAACVERGQGGARDPLSGLACSRGHRTHAPPSRPPGLQTEGAVGEASRRLGIQPDRHHGAPIACLTVQPPETATISCPPAPRPPAPSSRQPPLRALQKHQQLEFDSSWCNQRAFRRVPRTSEHTRGGNAFQVDGKGPLFRPRASTKLTPKPEWPQSRARAITGRPRGCRIPASIRES